MRISIFTLLSIAICGLVTSCIPPYPPNYDPNQNPVDQPEIPAENQVINDEGQQQLADARERLEGNLPTIDSDLPSSTPPVDEKKPKPYPYAKKVPGKPGFVFNPYTKNQVDVRGIPRGQKVRDPYDENLAHIFLVP